MARENHHSIYGQKRTEVSAYIIAERKKEDQLFINGIIKRFGDCTRDDLFQYADYLDEKAEEIHQSADYYRTIADRLDAGQKVDSLESEAL